MYSLKDSLMRKALLLVVSGFLCTSILVFAGTTGKITGKVTDKKTGTGLPGVTIRLLQNPKIGGITRPTGEFTIINVPSGEYTVKATAIGYESVEKTGVRVSADATVEVNFKIGSKVMEGKDTVIVIAERNPAIDPGRSVSKRTTTEEQIKAIPRETVQGILGLTVGVTVDATNGGFSIRGGRSTETSVRVDGMEITDQQLGSLGTNANFYPTVPTLGVEEVQVVSGGFAAEYGHALSGIVNTVTKEGRADKYEGQIKYKTDLPGLNGTSTGGSGLTPLKLAGQGQDLMQFGFGGPIPGIDGLRFYISGQGDARQHRGEFFAVNSIGRLALIDPQGNNIGQLPNDRLFIRELNGKLTWDASQDIKFSLSAFQGATFYELGRWSWRYADDTSLVSMPTQYGDSRRASTLGSGTTWGFQNGNVKLPDYITNVRNVNQINQSFALRMNHTLTKTTVYEIGVGFFSEGTTLGKKDVSQLYGLTSWNGWNLYGFNDFAFADAYSGDNTGKYIDPAQTQLNGPDGIVDRYYDGRAVTSTGTKRVQNAITGHYEGFQDYTSTHNAYGLQNAFIATGDEGGLEKKQHEYIQVDGNIQSQIDEHNLAKAGFESRFLHERRNYNGIPWDGSGQNLDNYDYHPFDASVYFQDKAEYAGVVLTPGIRFDYFDPNSFHLKDPTDYEPYTVGNPKWIKSETKFQVSPRFGISYPISERTQFHISYGWFFQVPAYDRLYSSLGVNTSAILGSVLGNPNLGAQKTKSYEFGVAHQLGEDLVMEITGYYKDQYNIEGTTQYSPLSASGTNSVAYTYYTTGEYANQRGIEVTLKKTLSHNYTLVGNVSFSQAHGTSSSLTQSRDLSQVLPPDQYNNNKQTTYYPTSEYPMDYDRPVVGNVIVNVNFAKNEGPSISGIHFLENLNLNLTTTFQSGTPYTRLDRKTGAFLGEINGQRNPNVWQSDMRLERFIPLKEIFGDAFGNLEMSLYLDINNLFNRTEPISYYARTGTADDDGSTLKIGDFDATVWYAKGTGNGQVDQYGRQLYTTQADGNHDGIVDQQEKFDSYERYHHDALSRRLNYQMPREVWFGASLRF